MSRAAGSRPSGSAQPAGKPSPTDGARSRRFDPERRERIIAACQSVVAEHGVGGTSARRVAAEADVPLGSVTYHFSGMDEVLHEAFSRFTASVGAQFERRMSAASTLDEAKSAVVALITTDVFGTHRDLVLTHELYTLAARDERFRDLTEQWMTRSRRALGRHFDPVTVRLLDALIEGLTIHRALNAEPNDDQLVQDGVGRIVAGASSAL